MDARTHEGLGPVPYAARYTTAEARMRIGDAMTRAISALADIKKELRDHPTLLDADRWDLFKEHVAMVDEVMEQSDA